MEHAIDPDFIAPLKKTMPQVFRLFLEKHLLGAFPIVTNELLQVGKFYFQRAEYFSFYRNFTCFINLCFFKRLTFSFSDFLV